jgi:hypothetical protein
MPTKLCKIGFAAALLVAAATVLTMVPPTPATELLTVQGRTFDIWVSPSFAPPPHQPFFDCMRFNQTEACLDACGDCGPFTESRLKRGQYTLWVARIPCGGLDLEFVGTSANGLGPQPVPVLGASVLGFAQNTSFGTEGVENPTCSLETMRSAANPYAKPQ